MSPQKRHAADLPSPHRLRRLAQTARTVARETGAFVAGKHRPDGLDMTRKGVGDFVTAVDLAAETRLRRQILAAWPDHGIVGEELPAHEPDAEFVWILDPIDGTSNFGRGHPIFAVSVACLHAGRPIAAAVHCLPEDVTYHAAKGCGARRGRRPLVLPPRRQGLSDAAILGLQWHRGRRSIRYLDALTATGTRVRNFGCTVTQLCDVATGRLDGNVQEQGKIWDFAAAALLVTEAGGRFTSWRGDDIFPLASLDWDRHYPSLAAAPAVHRQLCKILGPHEHSL
jgi:myo-inositol-1(or 4)-monophosphatase